MTESNMLTNMKLAELLVEYEQSGQRLILLDYDGTLVNIKNHPSSVIPGEEVLRVVKLLATDERNTLAIITGRDQEYISQWFGDMNIYIFAEHGSFIKEPGHSSWTSLFTEEQNWKSDILSILESFTKKAIGSMIEQKFSAITWHYRNVDPIQAFTVAEELLDFLKKYITPDMNISILEGKKVIEIKQKGYDKGSACKKMLQLKNFSFILAIGDDTTDEDMFKTLPSYAYTFKIGYGSTYAKMNLENPVEAINLLNKVAYY